MTDRPTDAEIEELARPFISRVGSHWEHDDAIPDNGRIEEFARAVLAKWGAQPAPAASPEPITRAWVDEVRQYLVAAADSSMSRNNSEQLASELLDQMPQATAGPAPLTTLSIAPVRRFLADRGIYLSDETTKA